MKKFICIIANLTLLVWFFLDMTGVYFENTYLVTTSWRDDGLFFLVFVFALVFFIVKERIGKFVLIIWQTLWLITQIISHEWYTLVGGGGRKISYFKDSIKLIHSESRYIPDLYHIILHLLIFIALVTTILYTRETKKQEL